jgi:hypothetical protein
MYKPQPIVKAASGQSSSTGSATFPNTPPSEQPKTRSDSWYEAMAQAWSEVIDKQAQQIVGLSAELTSGVDNPGTAVQLQAQAQKMAFMSTAASTSINTVGNALEVLSKKQ